MLLSEQEIKDLLQEANDIDRYDSLYRQLRKAFGEPDGDGNMGRYRDGYNSDSGAGSSRFPSYEDISLSWQVIGQSRRILTNQTIALSRIRSQTVVPDFPQVDRYTNEIRKQFYMNRASDHTPGGGWDTEFDLAFLEGDSLGASFCQISMDRNPMTGKLFTSLRHVSALQVLIDPHERNYDRARWVCFCHHVPALDAIAMYGAEVKAGIQTAKETGGRGKKRLNYVRIFQFFSRPFAGREATYAVLLDDIGGTMLERKRNAYQTLPMAHYTSHVLSQMRHPLGRIPLQMPLEAKILEYERLLDAAIKVAPFTILDVSNIEDQDVQDLIAGKFKPYVRLKSGLDRQLDSKAAVQSIPGAQVNPLLSDRMSILEQQLTAQSGVNDFDRGTTLGGRGTATEAQILDQRSSTQGLWPVKQIGKFYGRVADCVSRMARDFDDDALEIDLFGTNITLNDPAQPMLSASEFFKEPSKIVIDEDAISSGDQTRKQAQRDALLASLESLVSIGLVDPVWYAEQKLTNLGFDPSEAMSNAGNVQSPSDPLPQNAPPETPVMDPVQAAQTAP
jgi:hypothetical protein